MIRRRRRADHHHLGLEIAETETLDVGEAAVGVDKKLGSDDRRRDHALADLLGRVGQARRHLQTVAQRRARLRRLDRVDPARERPAIARVVRDDLGRVGKLDHHRQVVAFHVGDDLLRLLFRFRQPVGADVGRRHARRAINEQHEPLPLAGRSLHPRAGECEHRQRNRQKLQEQQEITPEPSETGCSRAGLPGSFAIESCSEPAPGRRRSLRK